MLREIETLFRAMQTYHGVEKRYARDMHGTSHDTGEEKATGGV